MTQHGVDARDGVSFGADWDFCRDTRTDVRFFFLRHDSLFALVCVSSGFPKPRRPSRVGA